MIWLYNGLLPAARLGARAWALGNDKLARGLRARRDAEPALRALGAQIQDPLLWLHSTSVGEYEQARPIAALWSREHPDWRILHTFTSPSGYDYAERLGEARHAAYLPEDSPGRTARVLDALKPRALVFVKFDLWPNLVFQAHARRIPVVLVDATLRADSARSKWPARALYRALYNRMQVISAVSERDADRFRAIVPRHPHIVVDGDTRFDQVMRRRQNAHRVTLPEALARNPKTITCIAGSTWGPDEERIVPAFAALSKRSDPARLRLVLVPHEPSAGHLAALEARLGKAGLASVRLSQLDRPRGGRDDAGDGAGDYVGAHARPASVVLVDRVGVLAELYANADVAYVGGAFTTGVHNVMEPAIMGLPVFFGPKHGNAPEAEMLLEKGAAGVIRSAADLERQLQTVVVDAATRSRMGCQARAYVEANLGASQRCVARIRDVVETSRRAKESA